LSVQQARGVFGPKTRRGAGRLQTRAQVNEGVLLAVKGGWGVRSERDPPHCVRLLVLSSCGLAGNVAQACKPSKPPGPKDAGPDVRARGWLCRSEGTRGCCEGSGKKRGRAAGARRASSASAARFRQLRAHGGQCGCCFRAGGTAPPLSYQADSHQRCESLANGPLQGRQRDRVLGGWRTPWRGVLPAVPAQPSIARAPCP
jgi:hypothetical protein